MAVGRFSVFGWLRNPLWDVGIPCCKEENYPKWISGFHENCREFTVALGPFHFAPVWSLDDNDMISLQMCINYSLCNMVEFAFCISYMLVRYWWRDSEFCAANSMSNFSIEASSWTWKITGSDNCQHRTILLIVIAIWRAFCTSPFDWYSWCINATAYEKFCYCLIKVNIWDL